jgi:hypothetical protein
VFSKYLATKYPESFDPLVPAELVYSGAASASLGGPTAEPQLTAWCTTDLMMLEHDRAEASGPVLDSA